MVTAGVYMIVRCSAIFTHAPATMFIVAIIGAATAIFAATIGLAQNDIKKVLAYSTVSQLGYMMLACGVGAFVAAIFHVMTHAFFKALLFLGSGSVIHGMHHEQDMRRMGGLKKYMPVTFAAMAVGWLAISGFPLLSGFFSKDEILWKTWSTNAVAIPAGAGQALWFVAAITAALTAIYMTRLMVMTFWGTERFREAHADDGANDAHAHNDAHESLDETDFIEEEEHEEHHAAPAEPHESPWTMTVPLVVLAILSAAGGLVGIPYALSGGAMTNYFERALEPVVARAPERGEPSHGTNAVERGTGESQRAPAAHGDEGAVPQSVGEGEQGATTREHAPDPGEVSKERLFTGISIIIGLIGIGIGFWYFKRRPLTRLPKLLENKYYVDEFYDAAIINPIKTGSREGLWKIFDVGVIDWLVNGLARGTRELGDVSRRAQQGFVRGYAAIILVGALAVIGYFVLLFARVFR
jgi:NADH-quinone oxidoreductase subunit L